MFQPMRDTQGLVDGTAGDRVADATQTVAPAETAPSAGDVKPAKKVACQTCGKKHPGACKAQLCRECNKCGNHTTENHRGRVTKATSSLPASAPLARPAIHITGNQHVHNLSGMSVVELVEFVRQVNGDVSGAVKGLKQKAKGSSKEAAPAAKKQEEPPSDGDNSATAA